MTFSPIYETYMGQRCHARKISVHHKRGAQSTALSASRLNVAISGPPKRFFFQSRLASGLMFRRMRRSLHNHSFRRTIRRLITSPCPFRGPGPAAFHALRNSEG